MGQFVHHPFLRKEVRRIERRTQRPYFQVPTPDDPMFEQSPVGDIVHLVLRDSNLVETAIHTAGARDDPTSRSPSPSRAGTAATLWSPNGQQLGRASDAGGVVSPRLVLPGRDLAVRVDGATNVCEVRRAVVVPAEFVLATQLQADWLAKFLRHDRGTFSGVGIAAAAVCVRTGEVLHAHLVGGQIDEPRNTRGYLIDALSGAHHEGAVARDVGNRAVRRHRPM